MCYICVIKKLIECRKESTNNVPCSDCQVAFMTAVFSEIFQKNTTIVDICREIIENTDIIDRGPILNLFVLTLNSICTSDSNNEIFGDFPKEAVKKIKKYIYLLKHNGEVLENNDYVICTECKKPMNSKCIKQWLEKKETCPHCRADLQLEKFIPPPINYEEPESIPECVICHEKIIDPNSKEALYLQQKEECCKLCEKESMTELQLNVLLKEKKRLDQQIKNKETSLIRYKTEADQQKKRLQIIESTENINKEFVETWL